MIRQESPTTVASTNDPSLYENPHIIVDSAMGNPTGEIVVIDLSKLIDMTTADFARLLLLRQQLLTEGRDLQITGLRGRSRALYDIYRLHTALPRCLDQDQDAQ